MTASAAADASGNATSWNIVIGSDALKPFMWFAGAVLAVSLLISVVGLGISITGALRSIDETERLSDAYDKRVTDLAARYDAKVAYLTARYDAKVDTITTKSEDQTRYMIQVAYWLQRVEVAKPGLKLPPAPQRPL